MDPIHIFLFAPVPSLCGLAIAAAIAYWGWRHDA